MAAVASGGSGSERSRSRAARSSGALTPWRRLVRVRTAVGDDRKQLQPSLPPSRSVTGTWVQGRRGHPRCGAATPCQVQPHPQKKKKLQPRRPSPRCRRGVSCAAVARGLSVWGRGRGEWGLSPAWLIMEGHGRRPANGNLVPRRRRPVVFWTEQRRRREVGFIDRLNEIEPGWKIRRERK